MPQRLAGGDVVDAYLTPVSAPVPVPVPVTQSLVEEPVDDLGLVEPVEQADDAAGIGWGQRRAERLDAGETSSVRRRRRASAEATRKAEVVDPKVTRREADVDTAARLEELAEDPRAEARGNRRARTWLMSMAATGIALGVGISASSAQQTITHFMHWAVGTVAADAAYGADPALGLVLFATLGARILASARGVEIPERARAALNRIELVLFGLVAVLNAGPSLGALLNAVVHHQWAQVGPDVMVLVIHTLGPVLVACGVFGVPFMAVVLAEITAATNAKQRARQAAAQAAEAIVGAGVTGGVTAPSYSENTPSEAEASNPSVPSREDEVTAELLELVAGGQWSWPVSARAIRERFGCGMDIARAARDRVRTHLHLPGVAA